MPFGEYGPMRPAAESLGDTVERLRQENLVLREQIEDWKWAATHDALTELLNLRGLDYELSEQAALPGDIVVVADLDGFKKVNDTLGHQAGDGLLALISRHFQNAVRASDLVARIGGDEFLALLRVSSAPETDSKDHAGEENRDSNAHSRLTVARFLARLGLGVEADINNNPNHVILKEIGLDVTTGFAYVDEFGFEAAKEAADQDMYAHKPNRRS